MREVLERIKSDPRYQRNLDWGRPRHGHPEGTVRGHILQLEKNLEALRDRLTEEQYWKLAVLIHVHDSFKAESKGGVPITHPASHASLARNFLSEFCQDQDLLNMVQYHDEPFALWRQFDERVRYNSERLQELIQSIEDWDLFLAFLVIDGCTEGKSREVLKWFFFEVSGKVSSAVDATWILP